MYFLNAVTVADLMALAESSPEVVPEPLPEPEPEPEKSGGVGTLLLVLAVLALGGGARWYFKIYRPKQQAAAPGPGPGFPARKSPRRAPGAVAVPTGAASPAAPAFRAF